MKAKLQKADTQDSGDCIKFDTGLQIKFVKIPKIDKQELSTWDAKLQSGVNLRIKISLCQW